MLSSTHHDDSTTTKDKPLFTNGSIDVPGSDSFVIDWKKFDLDAGKVQRTPMLVCRGQRSITTHHMAAALGEALFNHIKRTEENPDYLTMLDFAYVRVCINVCE